MIFATTYLLNGTQFSSRIYASGSRSALEISKRRGLNEVIDGSIPVEFLHDQLQPSDYFDKKDYIRCIHTIIFYLSILNDEIVSRASISDIGILHEVVHLADGVELHHDTSILDLRKRIKEFEKNVPGSKANYESMI